MKGMDLVLNIETLEIAKTYLFGGVKYLDLLLLLSFIDVFTGVVKAVKQIIEIKKCMVWIREKVHEFCGRYPCQYCRPNL